MGIRIHKDWAFYAPFQFFWILVILPKALQLVCLGGLMLLCAFRSGREKPLDKFSILQLVFMLIYGVAIVVNALGGDHDMKRIFAAANTWAINLVALFMYHFYRHQQLDVHKVEKSCLINLIIIIGFWLVYRVISPRSITILGHMLSVDDWVNGAYFPRFTGFLDYTNLVIFAILFFYPFAVHFLSNKKIWAAVLTVTLFLPVYSTNSRTGLLLYLIVILAYALFGLQKNFFVYYQQRKYALLAVSGLVVVILLTAFAAQLTSLVQSLLGMRAGSNSMRMLIYQTTLKTMWEQSPVIGVGIKSLLEGTSFPLGSHSTYLGVFFKAGIIGGLLYLISIFGLAGKKLLSNDPHRYAVIGKLCMLAVLLLMVFEDIDGANWCICIFYISLALLNTNPTPPYKNIDYTEGHT